MDGLTDVPLGMDFRAQVIAEACRAAGLKVQLITSDSWYGELPEYRLLVRSGNLEGVLALVEKSGGEAPRSDPA